MIGFLIGLVVGGIFGVIVMALMNAASEADDHAEKQHKIHRWTSTNTALHGAPSAPDKFSGAALKK